MDMKSGITWPTGGDVDSDEDVKLSGIVWPESEEAPQVSNSQETNLFDFNEEEKKEAPQTSNSQEKVPEVTVAVAPEGEPL